jgi:hypothetical protein
VSLHTNFQFILDFPAVYRIFRLEVNQRRALNKSSRTTARGDQRAMRRPRCHRFGPMCHNASCICSPFLSAGHLFSGPLLTIDYEEAIWRSITVRSCFSTSRTSGKKSSVLFAYFLAVDFLQIIPLVLQFQRELRQFICLFVCHAVVVFAYGPSNQLQPRQQQLSPSDTQRVRPSELHRGNHA